MTYRFLSLLPVPIACVVAGLAGYEFNSTATGGLFALECIATSLVVHGLLSGARDPEGQDVNEQALYSRVQALEIGLDNHHKSINALKADAIEQIEARKKFAEKYLPGDPWSQGQ